MSKSLNARCIRRWEVEFKPLCDSKRNLYWRKRDLRGYIREAAFTTAYSMVESMAELEESEKLRCAANVTIKPFMRLVIRQTTRRRQSDV